MVKRIYLDDEEDCTCLIAEVDKQFTGIELWFEGPTTSLYALTGSKMAYGVVDKKIMYRFCKRMINQLEKEGIK